MQSDFDVLFQKYPRACPENTYFEHGPGWLSVLDKFFAEVEAFLPAGVEWANDQIKEKYGTLSLNCHPVWPEGFSAAEHGAIRDEIWSRLTKAEILAECRSAVTCETCGQPGVLRGMGWIFTACDEHSKGVDPMEGNTGTVSIGPIVYRYDPVADELVTETEKAAK